MVYMVTLGTIHDLPVGRCLLFKPVKVIHIIKVIRCLIFNERFRYVIRKVYVYFIYLNRYGGIFGDAYIGRILDDRPAAYIVYNIDTLGIVHTKLHMISSEYMNKAHRWDKNLPGDILLRL